MYTFRKEGSYNALLRFNVSYLKKIEIFIFIDLSYVV